MRSPMKQLLALLLAALLPGLPAAAASFADAPRPRSGEQVVQYQCSLCHGPGLAGAPRIGDRKAWSARAHDGVDRLVLSATRGRGAMPPGGGLSDLSEPELRAAIVYMLRRSGVDNLD